MVLEFINARDYSLMRRVHRWPAPLWIRVWMICATRGGDGWLWDAMGLGVLLFGGPPRVSAGLGIAAFVLLKKCATRQRPCAIEPHCWATLLPPDRFSFPSGHTITAFSVAISLSEFYPALLPALLFCALSIAASRILLGMHFLSDVVAGAVLGAGLA